MSRDKLKKKETIEKLYDMRDLVEKKDVSFLNVV